MSPPMPTTELCESCGYALAGLAETAVCPECAWPIANSLLSRRTGSPWQQRRRFGWIITHLHALVSPRPLFDRIAIERTRSRSLLLLTTLLVSLIVGLAPFVEYAVFSTRFPAKPPSPLNAALDVIGSALIAWLLLLMLSSVAIALAMLVGRLRSWRVDLRVAGAVCAHASAGLLPGAAVIAALECVALVVGLTERGNPDDAVSAAMFSGFAFGIPFGLVWFAHLMHMGTTACRFANPPHAAPTVPA